MTQMRHDSFANALSLVFPIYSCRSASEPRSQALAGEMGMSPPGQHRGGAAAARACGSACRGCAYAAGFDEEEGGLRRGLD